MDWGAFVLGGGGLAVGGLTVVLSYRERTSGYRHALYDRQVTAVTEVLQLLTKWYEAAQQYIMSQPSFPVLSEETRNGMRIQTSLQSQEFYSVFKSHAVVLPQEFLNAVSRYQLVFNALSAPPQVASQYDRALVESQDPGTDMSLAYGEVVAAGRRVVGTEPLTAQSLRLFGKGSEDETGEAGAHR